MHSEIKRVAVMWRANPSAPDVPTHYQQRLLPVFEQLAVAGFSPEPAPYLDENVGKAREQLLCCDAVLVWINPIADGATRDRVDALLREVAQQGVWVSAHPDVIDKLGVKRVLFTARELSCGSATHLYEALEDFDARFAPSGARVLKPNRGNDGRGVLRVAPAAGAFDVQRASDDVSERLTGKELRALLAPAFAGGGVLVDQEFHAVTEAGMVRCYLSGSAVIGFGLHAPRSPSLANAFGMNSAKEMHDRNYAPLADLCEQMETEWVPALQRLLALDERDMPVLWDADFLHRRPSEGRSRFALCEINVSCVSPFPAAAPEAIAGALRKHILDRGCRTCIHEPDA